jgi:ABC-type polysaccharide/polyol phosphate export permease
MSAVAVVGDSEWNKRLTHAHRAAADLVAGLRLSWLWTALAQQDIKLRYRGSILGPFWQTLTTAIMIGGMGFLYPRLFHTTAKDYLPMLAAGLVFWAFVSGMITDGCRSFIDVQHIMHVVKLPFSVHAYRSVYRNILTLAHNFIIVPIIMFFFPPSISWTDLLMVIPAFLIVTLNGVWISILFGMISARYRDVPPVVVSVVQLLLFVTPIFWQLDQLGPEGWWVQFSPLFAAIDVMRAPLLGASPAPYSWDIVLFMTVAGCGTTFLFFARFRHRLAFWV